MKNAFQKGICVSIEHTFPALTDFTFKFRVSRSLQVIIFLDYDNILFNKYNNYVGLLNNFQFLFFILKRIPLSRKLWPSQLREIVNLNTITTQKTGKGVKNQTTSVVLKNWKDVRIKCKG